MQIIKVNDYEALSRKAAAILGAEILHNPEAVLGLATGSTPVKTYQYLISWYKDGLLDFSHATTVNLDEYRGLSSDDPQSYRHFMNEKLFHHINIDKNRTFIPDGSEPDAQKACQDYEDTVRTLGYADIQLLGLGNNGHIGFNEPDDSFSSRTQLVKLTDSTIEANKRFFASIDDVPKEAYTMGIGTIMKAKKILLIANGKSKAEAIRKTCLGPVTPRVPASILQFHPDVTIIVDEEAGRLL